LLKLVHEPEGGIQDANRNNDDGGFGMMRPFRRPIVTLGSGAARLDGLAFTLTIML
jgi:hypothetical protein